MDGTWQNIICGLQRNSSQTSMVCWRRRCVIRSWPCSHELTVLPHTFSMGFKSHPLLGYCRSSMSSCSASHVRMIIAVWMEQLSCTNIKYTAYILSVFSILTQSYWMNVRNSSRDQMMCKTACNKFITKVWAFAYVCHWEWVAHCYYSDNESNTITRILINFVATVKYMSCLYT